jgi:hypothetical protein
MRSLWMKLIIAQLVFSLVFVAPLFAATTATIETNGTGTVVTNCFGTLYAGCTVTANGSMTGTPMLTGQYYLRFDTGSPTSLNGYPAGTPSGGTQQGVCLPASFIGSLTSGADSIYFSHVGFACEEAQVGSAYHFHGTFRITGGTGQFAAATGGGVVMGTFTRTTSGSFIYLRGSITY